MRPSASITRQPGGFTLVELMIVLALIGIFTGLMVANMRGTYEDALLRSTARKIISTAALANSKAITLGHAYSLLIDSSGGSLRLLAQGVSEPVQEEKLDARIQIEVRKSVPQTEDDAEEQQGPPLEREAPPDQLENIHFLPDGTADAREILLRDRMGVELLLQINPITARLRIVESEAPR
jgi:type II secretion system protein H